MKPPVYTFLGALAILLTPVITCGNPYGYYLIMQAGGMVHDAPKSINEAQQYVQNENKLNLIQAANGDAKQNYTALQGMEKTYGDGSGVPSYIPGQLAADPQEQMSIDLYAKNLPNTPQGSYLSNYFQRQQQRDRVIQAYSARLRAQAAAADQPTLTLQQCAGVSNSLADLGYDNRIQAINEAAETDSLKTMERDQRLKLMEYRRLRDDADSAWK